MYSKDQAQNTDVPANRRRQIMINVGNLNSRLNHLSKFITT